MSKKKIGVLGGSFDPLHFGHLNMAIALLEAKGLDSVLFCPANISPFKTSQPPIAAAEQRLEMLLCGIQKIPQFSLLDWEIMQHGPSFTVDTIQKLKTTSDADLFLLLGEDQLSDLHRWKDVERLFTLCTPLIATRDKQRQAAIPHLSSSLQTLLAEGYTTIPMMEISSTAIRERLRQKKICTHLVPHLTLDYIERHRLYS